MFVFFATGFTFTAYCCVIFLTGAKWLDHCAKEGSGTTRLSGSVFVAFVIEVLVGLAVILFSVVDL